MKLLIVLAVTVLGLLALIWVFQRRLIYFPTQHVINPSLELPRVEEVELSTDDGLVLTAWFVAPEHPSSGMVILFNGNAGNRSDRIPLARELTEEGYGALLVDYRGYGNNTGSPSESGLAADARAAFAFLKTRDDVDPARLAYFGESLGAAVALGLAVEHPPAALLLRSPFTSLADVGSTHYPWLPVSFLLWDQYPNTDRIEKLETPVMVIAGSADRIVPPQQSIELYEAASQPKQLVVIEQAGHNDFELLAGEKMIGEIDRFLDKHLRAGHRD